MGADVRPTAQHYAELGESWGREEGNIVGASVLTKHIDVFHTKQNTNCAHAYERSWMYSQLETRKFNLQ